MLHRADDDFLLLYEHSTTKTQKYKLVITSIRLDVPYLTLNPALHKANEMMLMRRPTSMAINVSEFFTLPVASGLKSIRWSLIRGGILPKKMLIWFVDTDALHGAPTKNPFYMQPFGINHLQVFLNNDAYPSEPFQPDFDKNSFLYEYRWLIDNVGLSQGACMCVRACVHMLSIRSPLQITLVIRARWRNSRPA